VITRDKYKILFVITLIFQETELGFTKDSDNKFVMVLNDQAQRKGGEHFGAPAVGDLLGDLISSLY